MLQMPTRTPPTTTATTASKAAATTSGCLYRTYPIVTWSFSFSCSFVFSAYYTLFSVHVFFPLNNVLLSQWVARSSRFVVHCSCSLLPSFIHCPVFLLSAHKFTPHRLLDDDGVRSKGNRDNNGDNEHPQIHCIPFDSGKSGRGGWPAGCSVAGTFCQQRHAHRQLCIRAHIFFTLSVIRTVRVRVYTRTD